MADLVGEALFTAVEALRKEDKALASQVIADDDLIDLKEVEIEEACLRVIALRHPVGEELREVFTVLKIITDLERMGDEATNIAKLLMKLEKGALQGKYETISLMAQTCVEMLKSAIRAFVERDSSLAEEAFKRDALLDEFYIKALDQTVFSEACLGNPREGMGFLFISRFLERFGDHASNIAERVYYMVTGKRIKVELGIRRGV